MNPFVWPFQSTYRQKHDEFKKLFEILPNDEQLIVGNRVLFFFEFEKVKWKYVVLRLFMCVTKRNSDSRPNVSFAELFVFSRQFLEMGNHFSVETQ